LDEEVFCVAAGIGSAKTFRLNLAKRTLEAFSNLHWMLPIDPRQDWIEAEFRVYETLYNDLTRLGVGEILLAETPYRRLAKELGR
jgi:hypothetical protein